MYEKLQQKDEKITWTYKDLLLNNVKFAFSFLIFVMCGVTFATFPSLNAIIGGIIYIPLFFALYYLFLPLYILILDVIKVYFKK